MNKNPNYTIVREMKGYTRADLEKERNEIYMRRQGKEGGGGDRHRSSSKPRKRTFRRQGLWPRGRRSHPSPLLG